MSDTRDPTGLESLPDDVNSLDGEYDPSEVEERWQQSWTNNDIYAYANGEADTLFAIDAPPPTVSGNIHWGNTYGFILQDFVARFHRMHSDTVFFPFGYDNNGIATERLTERELGIRHENYERQEFQEKCKSVSKHYEQEFKEVIQSLGLSVDWDNTYRTIEEDVQRISQLSFIDLYEKGREYRQRAPAIWCPDCETAISQVEMEDAEEEAHFYEIEFPLVDPDADQESVVISTTRPDLLPACVAVFVHPEDEDHADIIGEKAEVPLFNYEVPILADKRVNMETGTGVVKCSTFGDQTDVEWYQAYDLPLRRAIDESGTMTDLAGQYAGLSADDAREAIARDLDMTGSLLESRPVTHTVPVHERCHTGVEFLVTEQWYVKLLDRVDEYLEAGKSLEWHPEKMLTRYVHWVEGLEWDWCISRQRDSGIPFPVWYCADCGDEVLAEKADLPVDPMADDPPIETCPECGHGEFEPEPDVFDTWATSSLTPLINAGWDYDAETGEYRMEHPELYPMDLRPQGHDIISFWLFHTVVKCYEHTGEVPFDDVMINGLVLDDDRRKMSMSRGNVVDPLDVLDEYPVDAARYWAAGTSVGDDFPFKIRELDSGKRLLQKLWNASKLVDQLTVGDEVTEPERLEEIDRWLLAELDELIKDITGFFEEYAFSKAKDRLRSFFWNTFCDDYLETAKHRDLPSTNYTLLLSHRTFLKLFAPILPHVTEEIWQTLYSDDVPQSGSSLHTTNWPEPRGFETDLEVGETAMAVLSALRKYKTERNMSLTAPLDRVEVYGDIHGFADPIANTMHVQDFVVLDSMPETSTEIESIDLNYALVGPEFGDGTGEIEDAIQAGDFEYDGESLHVAGATLGPEYFEITETPTYVGEGDLLEADSALVIVKRFQPWEDTEEINVDVVRSRFSSGDIDEMDMKSRHQWYTSALGTYDAMAENNNLKAVDMVNLLDMKAFFNEVDSNVHIKHINDIIERYFDDLNSNRLMLGDGQRQTVDLNLSISEARSILQDRERSLREATGNVFGNPDNSPHKELIAEAQQAYLNRIWESITNSDA